MSPESAAPESYGSKAAKGTEAVADSMARTWAHRSSVATIPPVASPKVAHRSMDSIASGASQSSPNEFGASLPRSVGPRTSVENRTPGCSPRQLSTRRPSAALLTPYSPRPGHGWDTRPATEDRYRALPAPEASRRPIAARV